TKAFTISGGSFTVTNDASQISGVFTMANGTTLSVSGGGASLTCAGAVSVDGASLFASLGGLLDLPSVRSCDEPELGQTTFTWQASGAGSVLRLANMTNVLGDGALNGTLSIQALAGGRVEL